MQCFICVTYMLVTISALPFAPFGPRALFYDVMSSLLMHDDLPPEGKHLADVRLLPRRNDRLERPFLTHRLSKTFAENGAIDLQVADYPGRLSDSKEEIILYVTTEPLPNNNNKPGLKKIIKLPRPNAQKNKNKIRNTERAENEDEVSNEGVETDETSPAPIHNNMSGQSHMGNRESQIVVKPTVIVNFRGTVSHRDSDIRLEGRRADEQPTAPAPGPAPHNVFNITQVINLERTIGEERRGQHNRGEPKSSTVTGVEASIREGAGVDGEHVTLQQKQIGRSVDNVF